MNKKTKTITEKSCKKQDGQIESAIAFSDLTWEDLKEWGGERVVSRGKAYRGQVQDLRMTGDGTLLAWVQGSDQYATQVRRDKQGNLSSQCTCPYGNSCKHAVATILVFLNEWKNGVAIPQAEATDERLVLLAGIDLSDNLNDLDPIAEALPPTIPGDELVHKHLEAMSKADLIKLILEGRDVVTEMRHHLLDRADLQDGNLSKLITSTRKEIDKASHESGWQNHWQNEGYTPDYSRVKQRLQTLLDSGQADAVIELGSYLMQKGVEQVGQSHDEGETSMEISNCMALVFKAALHSSKPTREQLLWEIELRLKDDYSILDGIPGRLEEQKAGVKEDWSWVADMLADRLSKLPLRNESDRDSFSSTYTRSRLMRWLLTALERAGRRKEIIPVLERETDQTDCYVELIKHLLDSGQTEKALEWARKGHVATQEKLPGIARQLEEQLRELAEKQKDVPLVAAYRAMEFFDRPCLEAYRLLQKASEKAKVWTAVREHILGYLETGRRPDIPPSSAWPLPAPQLAAKNKKNRWIRFPETSVLIDIAIHEKRMDDVLRWFRAANRENGFTHERSKVADAIHDSHPDEAIAIWKSLVATATRIANVSAYQTAGGYLGKMKKLLTHKKRSTEWMAYLTELRAHHARRPRMLDVLNSIEGCRTPIVGSGRKNA